jgi:signal transduction histidine kinase
VSERQLTLREQAAFLARLDGLAQDVRMERSVNNAQLAKSETTDHLLLSIYDNGQPMSFRGGWQPVTPRVELLDEAKRAAERAGVSIGDGSTDARYAGELRGGRGERYLAAVQTIGGYRNQRAVVMLMDMRDQDAQRASQRWLFAGITLFAIAAMSVFGWRFTARAVRPIAQAHAQQNAFVAAASHELRTPLQIMQTSLDALNGDPDDPSRFIRAMQRELNRMSRLSEDLTMLANARGEMDSLFGPVELTELANEAMRDHMAAAEEKQIELRLIAPETPPPPVEGDPLLLRRAINVLIDNAVCYTQRGGRIEVSIGIEQKQLLFCIQDDGPGIASEHQPHIFERFYRADQSRSDRAHSGLGLSIAKEIVERHGGQLSYENAKPRGSRFTIRLPRIPHES